MWSRWKCKSLKKNLLFHIRKTYRSDFMARKYWRSLWLANTISSKRTSEQIIAQYAMTNSTKIVITSPWFNFFIIKMVNSLKYNIVRTLLIFFFLNCVIMFSAHIKFWTDLCFKYMTFFSLWVGIEEWRGRVSTANWINQPELYVVNNSLKHAINSFTKPKQLLATHCLFKQYQ